jgi:hypothetical protein
VGSQTPSWRRVAANFGPVVTSIGPRRLSFVDVRIPDPATHDAPGSRSGRRVPDVVRTLIIFALVVALAGCSAAEMNPGEATSRASAVVVTTMTPTPEPAVEQSASLPTPVAPAATAAPTPKPTLDSTPKPALVGCPILPVTIDQIARLTSERALACFGGALLTFEAYVPSHPYGIGDTTTHAVSPTWLNGLGGSVVALSAGRDAGILVLAFVPPALGRCDAGQSVPECPFRFFWGRRVLVSAHFDGPIAHTCQVTSVVEGVTFTDSDAVAECRRALIVLSVGTAVPSASAAGG